MKIFHHGDADGRAAAAIVLHSDYHDSGSAGLYEVNYNDIIPVEEIVDGEEIYVVDFSFKPEVMQEVLKKTKDVIWIDHHASCKDYYPHLNGLRDFTNKGLCGCELTWKFLNPNKEIPFGIRLIGDYDSWRLADPNVFNFYEGLKLYNTNPRSVIWNQIINGDKNFIEKITNEGSACIKYRDSYCRSMCKHHGYEAVLDGFNDIRCFAANIYRFGSQGFGDLMKQFDICISYIHDGSEFTVSLYSENDKINVGEIAKQFGGGGHKGAAGFHCQVLPFRRK